MRRKGKKRLLVLRWFCVDLMILLEEVLATHSSILAWRIPWTEEPGRLHTVHRVTKSWTQQEQLSRLFLKSFVIFEGLGETQRERRAFFIFFPGTAGSDAPIHSPS